MEQRLERKLIPTALNLSEMTIDKLKSSLTSQNNGVGFFCATGTNARMGNGLHNNM